MKKLFFMLALVSVVLISLMAFADSARWHICNTCNGTKTQRCYACNGSGAETCVRCSGLGRVGQYRKEVCPDCKGSRCTMVLCNQCNGSGKTSNGLWNVKCPKCNGGKYLRKCCDICAGAGTVKCTTCKGLGKLESLSLF